MNPTPNPFGQVTNPTMPGPYQSAFGNPGGLILFFTNILRLVFVVAGILMFLNLILAGFQYMNAGGDSKALSAAWSRIWLSLVGLIIIIGSFALAALFGQLFFGRADFILNPQIYGP